MHILAHKDASLLGAIYCCSYIVLLTVRLMELSGDLVDVWCQDIAVVTILHSQIDEPVWNFIIIHRI